MKILKFGNEKCAPCRALNEFLKDNTPPNMEIISVTRETNPELFEKHGVRMIPLLIQIDEKGSEVKRWRKESFEFTIRHNDRLKEF